MNFPNATDITKPIKHHEHKFNSRGIMYHSRMRYLKSREGNKKNKKLSFQYEGRTSFESWNQENNLVYTQKAMLSATQQTSINIDSYKFIDKNKVCSPSKLLPPNELMSRSQAFRIACLKNLESSPMKKIRKIDSLSRKEDPRIINHRNDILSRIRRHTESLLQKNRMEMMNENIDDKKGNENNVIIKLDGEGEQLEPKKLDLVPGEYQNAIAGSNPKSTRRAKTKYEKKYDVWNNSHTIDSIRNDAKLIHDHDDDFDTYPAVFSFLDDWKNDI